jgi:prepilin-type processing-associated H-X9-DG protein
VKSELARRVVRMNYEGYGRIKTLAMTDSSDRARRVSLEGFALFEVLVVIVVVVILLAIILPALSTNGRDFWIVKDSTQLMQLHKATATFSRQFNGCYPTPSLIASAQSTDERDMSLDTTENLYSAMIAQNYVSPELLVSPVEPNDRVRAKADYDFENAWRPGEGVFWDRSFNADLSSESNVSYAHLVLFGERFEEQWQDTLNDSFALFGTRGPKDGKDDPKSLTYRWHRPMDCWVGNICYADGHVNLEDSFTVPGVTFVNQEGVETLDNFFAFDDGVGGSDIILSFTRSLTTDGPVVQHD